MSVIKYIVFFIFISVMWIPPAFFGMPTNYEPWYHKIYSVLVLLPFIGAFVFGVLFGKKVYLKVGICCLTVFLLEQVLFAANIAAQVGGAFGDIFGYWQAYGSLSISIGIGFIATAVPSFLSYLGGLIKDSR